MPKSSEQCPNSHSLLINRDSVQVLAAKSEQHMSEKKKVDDLHKTEAKPAGNK